MGGLVWEVWVGRVVFFGFVLIGLVWFGRSGREQAMEECAYSMHIYCRKWVGSLTGGTSLTFAKLL